MSQIKESTYQKSAPWLKHKERSNMLMLRMMSWISLSLGRRAGRSVLHLIALYFVLFAPASRRASLGYLPRALGRPATLVDLYRHFFCFASTIHDRIYLINRRHDLFDIDIQGEDVIRPLIAANKGVLLMGAHLGSFEVMRAIGRQLPGLKVAMVMHADNAQKIKLSSEFEKYLENKDNNDLSTVLVAIYRKPEISGIWLNP